MSQKRCLFGLEVGEGVILPCDGWWWKKIDFRQQNQQEERPTGVRVYGEINVSHLHLSILSPGTWLGQI